MKRMIFVTGTGTDVGKTVVTRGIVRALVNRGVNLHAVKPVESGVPVVNGVLKPHDGLALIRASKQERSVAQTCRYMFKAAVSPHLAAQNEGAVIDPQAVQQFLLSEAGTCDVLIVEGAGGLLVPLNDSTLYVDFIARLNCELLIVSPNVLGTINTTLLTIEAARKRDIPILGVVLNQGENDSLKNDEAIELFGQVPIVGTFPMMENIDDDELLATAAESHLKMGMIESGRIGNG
ncbi:MAG: dethiobiotin synthase [Deltaproteobacteria bacterium]|nr:dethiobiotin synthase [Deltaproteobacteria bacterium]